MHEHGHPHGGGHHQRDARHHKRRRLARPGAPACGGALGRRSACPLASLELRSLTLAFLVLLSRETEHARRSSAWWVARVVGSTLAVEQYMAGGRAWLE